MAGGTVTNNPDGNNTAPRYSPLSQPPWPQFPTGVAVQLRDFEAGRFFKRAMGILGLARLLNQCARLREDLTAFEEEQISDYPLSPFDEHNLWSALIVLCDDLASFAEELHRQALHQTQPQAAISTDT